MEIFFFFKCNGENFLKEKISIKRKVQGHLKMQGNNKDSFSKALVKAFVKLSLSSSNRNHILILCICIIFSIWNF